MFRFAVKAFFILFILCALPALVTAGSSTADAGDEILTLARVIELAAADAPDVRLSTTRAAEAEAKLTGAQVRTQEDPKIGLAAGPRNGPENGVDVEVGFEIPFDMGNRREKRIAVARADIQRERHAIGDVRRRAVTSAVGAFYRVLQAEERLRFVLDYKTLAEELLRIAKERYLAGDATKFEVNLAQTEVARADSDFSSAQGRIALARITLAQMLGLSSGAGLRIIGDIKDRSFFDTIRSLPAPSERADLQMALADLEASRAAVLLAEAERLPDLAFRLSYKREGRENMVFGGITISLPFLNPRQGPVGEARVQKQRAEIAVAIRKAAVATEIEGGRRAYDAAVESVRRIEAGGLALQQENESLAAESYRAGKINLSTLLQVRRDALDTRRVYLERLLEAAEIGVELASASGRWSNAN